MHSRRRVRSLTPCPLPAHACLRKQGRGERRCRVRCSALAALIWPLRGSRRAGFPVQTPLIRPLLCAAGR
jgi:hypothetical protein